MLVSEILGSIGFEQATDDSWHYNFGNGTVKAIQCFNPELYEGMSFFGSWRTERTAGDILFNLPLEVASYELGLAYLAYYFRSVKFTRNPGWLIVGQSFKDLLPWEIEAKFYNDKPVGRIENEWFRVLVNKLRALSITACDDDLLSVSFQDGVLKFENENIKLVCPGIGKDWEKPVRVRAKEMDILPKRIQKHDVSVYVWKGMLYIGNRRFNLQ